jgi:transposase
MPSAHPNDLRWRAVYGIWWDGLAFSDVADRLTMGPMRVTAAWVKSMWELFEHTGDVESRQGQRDAPPANLIVDDAAAHTLIQQILDAPGLTLSEQKAEFELTTGKTIHISTFCRAVRRLGFTRQKVTHGACPRSNPLSSPLSPLS